MQSTLPTLSSPPPATPPPSNGHVSRRRRRPTLWDVHTPPYGIPMPPPGSSNPIGQISPHTRVPNRSGRTTNVPAIVGGKVSDSSGIAGDGAGSRDVDGGYVPGANDIVRAPQVGEVGVLAGINVEALRALLNPKGIGNVSGGSRAVEGGGSTGGAVGNLGGVMHGNRHARRLYVGNLPVDTTDVQIEDFFNRALIAAKGVESEGSPVISVYMNLEKRFAFIETRTLREAAAGLALDGIKFREMFLRVRRPNDFNGGMLGVVKPPEGFNAGLLGIVSTQVSDGPNKVFIGGIPYTLSEDSIKELLSSFGALAAFNLIKEPTTGMSKGFAFFEYVDASVVDTACTSLHGMQVGDKVLTVRRASQSHGGGGGGSGGGTFASMGGIGLVNGSGTSDGKSAVVSVEKLVMKATRVVELNNVVSKEELGDDVEFGEIRDDMEEEGKKFGILEQVFIARPGEEGMENAVGRIFLKYKEVEEAERAHATMSGRKFGDNTVEAKFYDENDFSQRNF